MGNSVSQPTEMCQYFLAISLLKDYYLDSKNYISQFFIGNKSWSEGNEWQDSTNSLIVILSITGPSLVISFTIFVVDD